MNLKRNTKIRKAKKTRVIYIVVFFLFMIYAAYILYPLFFAVNASFKASGRVIINDSLSFAFNPFKDVFPKFSNYFTAFAELEHNANSYLMMVFNSIWYAGLGTLLGTLSSAMAAYVVCKYK